MDAKSSGADRRTAERIQTHHHVVFSDYRALGPLRSGTAVDRSSGGMRIITNTPEPLGTTLQIELRPNPDSPQVLLLEGRVVHITPIEKGQHAMGIKLMQPALRTTPAAPARERRVLVATVAASTAASQIKAPMVSPMAASVGMAPDLDMSEAVTFRRIEDGGRPGSWLALIAILALVVILVLLIVEALRQEQRVGLVDWFRDMNPGGIFAKQSPAEPATDSVAVSPNRFSITDSGMNVKPVATLVGGGDPVSHAVESVAPAVGAPAMPETPSDAAIQPGMPEGLHGTAPLSVDQFSAMLDYADRAAARGEPSLARAVVRRAMGRAGELPAAWRDLGADYQARLSAAGDDGAPHPLSAEIELDTPGDGRKSAADQIRLDVDTGDHMLRVWRGDQMLAEFPVGLGRDGATPNGDFRVGAKARNPDWYHEGRIVPAGDPGNPIGNQWLALQQDGTRTGIGIHPTQQPESIGADHSLGCVRMRPEDAEALYRLAPVGTAVAIHP